MLIFVILVGRIKLSKYYLRHIEKQIWEKNNILSKTNRKRDKTMNLTISYCNSAIEYTKKKILRLNISVKQS